MFKNIVFDPDALLLGRRRPPVGRSETPPWRVAFDPGRVLVRSSGPPGAAPGLSSNCSHRVEHILFWERPDVLSELIPARIHAMKTMAIFMRTRTKAPQHKNDIKTSSDLRHNCAASVPAERWVSYDRTARIDKGMWVSRMCAKNADGMFKSSTSPTLDDIPRSAAT